MAIDGLIYVADFLTDQEERSLLAAIDSEPWLDDLWRRVQHYGYRYDYKNRSVDSSQKLSALPEWAQQVAQRVAANGYMAAMPDQLIVNEYMPGQGIGAHVDAPAFGPVIFSVSLGTPCVMELTEVRGDARASFLSRVAFSCSAGRPAVGGSMPSRCASRTGSARSMCRAEGACR